jgi:hypothetical protein
MRNADPIQPGWRCQLVRYGKAGGYATSEIAPRFPLSHSAGGYWQIGPDRTALNPWTHTARLCRQGWDVKRKSLAALAPKFFLLTSPFIEPSIRGGFGSIVETDLGWETTTAGSAGLPR